MDQVNVVKGILDLFCHTFRQKINQGKSCIFFSRNVNQTRRCEMSEALGFNLMTNLGRCRVRLDKLLKKVFFSLNFF